MGGQQSSTQRRAASRKAKEKPTDVAAEISRNENVLILGSGHSGKSTFTNQIRVIYGDLSSEEERISYASVILSNVMQPMKAIFRAMEELEIPFEDPERVEDAQKIKLMYLDDLERFGADDLEQERPTTTLNRLLNDSGMQECVARSKYDLQDYAIYFLSSFERIRQPDYIPSVEDVVRCRIKTTGKCDFSFKRKDTDFTLVDVGGHRNERRKWRHFFVDMTAVLYLVDISSYDKVMWEDEEVNRLEDSLKLFEALCKLPQFAEIPFTLIFNKQDVFEEKIIQRPLGVHFGEYDGENTASDAFEYIKSLFVAISMKYLSREIPMYLTCVTDTENVRSIFDDFCDIIQKRNANLEA